MPLSFPRPSRRRFFPQLEALEDRAVPAFLTATNLPGEVVSLADRNVDLLSTVRSSEVASQAGRSEDILNAVRSSVEQAISHLVDDEKVLSSRSRANSENSWQIGRAHV